jgi:hypothetical protein
MKDIDKYFLTTNPPAELRKIAKAVNGLSLSTGEYAIYEPSNKMTAQNLSNISDSDKVDSIPSLINAANLVKAVGFGRPATHQKIVIDTQNAVMVADELGDVEPI